MVAAAGPSILVMAGTVTSLTFTVISHQIGQVTAILPGPTGSDTLTVAVDVSRLTTVPSHYVDVMYQPAPAPVSVTAQAPVTVTLPGDFRRPK